ncbi:MAG: GAF domain-containing protein [Candidatus Zixiibacteriota bacterium]|nr:MAG: GAF domain-containing protein [candidate division Zixibacteria bacterium]
MRSKKAVCLPDSGQANLKGLLDDLPMGVFRSSPEGKLEYVNGFLSRYLKPTDGKAGEDAGSLRNQISRQVQACLESDKPVSAKAADPADSNLLIRVVPQRDETGESAGALGWVQDLSDLSDLESRSEKKISELSILCELGKVLTSTLNLEEILQIVLIGVTAGQGLGFNRAFLLLLNQTGNDLEGKVAIGPSDPEEAKRIWDSLSAREQSLEEVLRSYKDALKEKDVRVNRVVRELRIPVSDKRHPLIQSMLSRRAFSVPKGAERSAKNLFDLLGTDHFAVAPLISKSKTLGVIIADNLMTRKAIEEEDVKLLSIYANHASAAIESSQLYQELEEKVQKLSEANRKIAESSRRLLKVERLSVLGQITSQVAHELRNPMTIIGGFAHSILKKMDASDPNHEYIKIIAKQTERMENVLDNVLNFSKPERSHLEIASLNDLVYQTIEMMEPEIDSSKITITTSASRNLSSVRVNPDLIRQALLNIFRNAVWAMPQGGILSVATRQTESWVKIEVKDTGFGISHEHMSKVFDSFFTTKPEGCGLGLTISSEIIKNHGGRIGVESSQGKGSTFYVELPRPGNAVTEESSKV